MPRSGKSEILQLSGSPREYQHTNDVSWISSSRLLKLHCRIRLQSFWSIKYYPEDTSIGSDSISGTRSRFWDGFEGCRKLLDTFLENRLLSRKTAFDSVIHKNSRKSFSNTPVDKENRDIAPSKSDVTENKAITCAYWLWCNLRFFWSW